MQSLEERFLSKVEKTAGCWEWRGFRSPQGYGMIAMKPGPPTTAHRVAYELYVGPIKKGLFVHHVCDNRGCVNPGHLRLTTNRDNILLGTAPTAANAKKTRCPRGHPYDAENTYYRRDRFGRHCRACQRERQRATPRSG